MQIAKIFTFDAAHHLNDYHGKCERMHGHTYKLEVILKGPVGDNGLIIDFVEFKRIVDLEVIEVLDHNLLNDVIKNPSAENIVMWIWKRLNKYKDFPPGVRLVKLILWETPQSCVTYEG